MVWVGRDPLGVESCEVGRVAGGWSLQGTIVRLFEERPAVISYAIRADASWRTRDVVVDQQLRGKRSSLTLAVRRSGWFVNGREDLRLAGCVDADLQASPVTNSLPIKRLRLGIGTGLEVTAAWVRFPSLRVEPLRQRYERIGRSRYAYSSGSFKAELLTDTFGLVRRYGNYWFAV